ncbi:hypothetical protein [uncultured Psychrobacter sp.]|uniref:hypothetical protein n=1 Tax=uncultured Psychrobacter sp. TaxID=259303 RepID=UPI003458366A
MIKSNDSETQGVEVIMQNIMIVNNYKAVIQYDPELGLFRGEFVGPNGGADFYGDSITALQNEGEQSLQTFLDVCQENGIESKSVDY